METATFSIISDVLSVQKALQEVESLSQHLNLLMKNDSESLLGSALLFTETRERRKMLLVAPHQRVNGPE